MKKFIFILLPLFFACNEAKENSKSSLQAEENKTPSAEITTYYLIRHAEKDRSNPLENDPDLNEEGRKRAQKWAEVFRDIDFDAIYSSAFKRTKETAQPTAKRKELDIQIYDPHNAYTEKFQRQTQGKTVLLVGHSNTNPDFVNKVIGQQKYANIADDENGSLFIVQVLPDGSTTSQVLYFD
ncbi:MAG: phosphoglycerate mutase family protein [Salegentibacter sp.]